MTTQPQLPIPNPQNVSVIMPSFFTGPVLLRAVKSVLSQKGLQDLVVVDNGNSRYIRGKLEEMKKENPRLRVISGQGNIGFARACNVGQRESSGEYLLFLHPDCVLPEQVFARAVSALEGTPDAWVAGCKLVGSDGSEQKGNRRNLMTFIHFLSEEIGLYKFLSLPRLELGMHPAPHATSIVPSISSRFMMIRRKHFQQLSEMDAGYFLHLEDLDLCIQVRKYGGQVVFLRDVEVIHYGGTHTTSSIQLAKYKALDLIHYFRKNFREAYFPGAFYLISALIYMRLLVQIVYYSAKIFAERLKSPLAKRVAPDSFIPFLDEYKEFIVDPKTDTRDSKYFITNRAPILITDAQNQTGLYLLRRLLAADCQIIALYQDRPIDLYHPKLTWLQADFGKRGIDIPKGTKIKTVLCTSPIQFLPPYLAKLKAQGVSRLITFAPLATPGHSPDLFVKKQGVAEQDISRICGKLDISYTMFRTPLVYGRGVGNLLAPLARFIRHFGYVPTMDDFTLYPPVHADDLAISAIKILNMEETFGKSYTLLGADVRVTFCDIIDRLFHLAGRSENVTDTAVKSHFFYLCASLSGNASLLDEIGYAAQQELLSSSAAQKDFGYTARSFFNITKKDIS